jgi:hypothetical protein
MLRSLFGPSKNDIWEQLSREIGARYQENGFFKRGSVRLTHREWEITLDDYVVHAGNATMVFTRIRAPFVNRDGFRFRIYRKGLFSWIGKLVGVQDVEIGDRFFDEQFIIQGEPPSMLTRLLMNPGIKEYIARQPDINLQVKDDEGWFGQRFPEGVDELYFLANGVIRDKERLRELFELFALILDELCQMGSAYETDPGMIPK